MSTKATILYGPTWHIYDDLLDGTIYLDYDDSQVNITIRLMNSSDVSEGLRKMFELWRNDQRVRDAEQRDEAAGDKGGDWVCPKCEHLNRYWVSLCTNCITPRPSVKRDSASESGTCGYCLYWTNVNEVHTVNPDCPIHGKSRSVSSIGGA